MTCSDSGVEQDVVTIRELGDRAIALAAGIYGVEPDAIAKKHKSNRPKSNVAKLVVAAYLFVAEEMIYADVAEALRIEPETARGRIRSFRRRFSATEQTRMIGEMIDAAAGNDDEEWPSDIGRCEADNTITKPRPTRTTKIGAEGVTTWTGTGKDFDAWCKARDMRFGPNAASIGDVKVNA